MDSAPDPSRRRPLPATLAEAINHEFRTPLAALLGHLELVQDQAGALPLDVARSLAVMQRAGVRLTELVTAVADIAELHDEPLLSASA